MDKLYESGRCPQRKKPRAKAAEPIKSNISIHHPCRKVKIFRKIAEILFRSLCTFGGGMLSAAAFLPLAWAERGYRGGIGGEYILVFAGALLGAWAADIIMGTVRGGNRRV